MNHKLYYAKESDLAKIAKVHMKAFPHSFSTKLGHAYCLKMLEWFITSNKSFLFFTEDENGLVDGFCGGIVSDGSLNTGSATSMVQHSFNKAIFSLILRPWLLFHPEILEKNKFIIKNFKNKFFRKVDKGEKQKNMEKQAPSVGLVAIGVLPQVMGKGVSTLLFSEFENKAISLNVSEVYLTVKSDNERAIKAYLKRGWKKEALNGNSLKMYKKLSNGK